MAHRYLVLMSYAEVSYTRAELQQTALQTALDMSWRTLHIVQIVV